MMHLHCAASLDHQHSSEPPHQWIHNMHGLLPCQAVLEMLHICLLLCQFSLQLTHTCGGPLSLLPGEGHHAPTRIPGSGQPALSLCPLALSLGQFIHEPLLLSCNHSCSLLLDPCLFDLLQGAGYNLSSQGSGCLLLDVDAASQLLDVGIGCLLLDDGHCIQLLDQKGRHAGSRGYYLDLLHDGLLLSGLPCCQTLAVGSQPDSLLDGQVLQLYSQQQRIPLPNLRNSGQLS